jgi:hypothetical protein
VSANGGDCHVGGSQVGVAKALDASGHATSDATTATAAVGTSCWRAEYGGDGTYLPSTDGSAAGECFTTASPAGGGSLGFEAAHSFTTYGTTDTQQVAVPNAAKRVLVFVFAGKFGGDSLTSVTYGGQPLQLLASRDAASVHLELRYLVNPPVGTAALAWSKTGARQNITWGYSVYSGVDQAAPFGTAAGAAGAGDAPTPKSVTVAAPTGTAVVDAVVFNDGAVTAGPTAGGGQNQRWSTRISTTQGGSSDKPGTGSTTVTWTPANGSGSVDWALVAAALQPSP